MELQKILEAIAQLDTQQFVELNNQLAAQRKKRAQEIQSAADRQIAVLTGGEVKGKRRSVPPKYLHPQTGQTWSGQGRQPRWMAEYLEQGGKEEDLKIK